VCEQVALSTEVKAGISAFYFVLALVIVVIAVFAAQESRRFFLPPKNDIELQRKKKQ